jgi:hypothetical protein
MLSGVSIFNNVSDVLPWLMQLSCIEVVTACVLEKYVQGSIGHNNHYLQLGLSMRLA